MSQTDLDAAIEQANRIFSRNYQPSSTLPGKRESPCPESKRSNCPPASLNAERRFGQPYAKLFPLIGRKVRTPAGPGTLLQVFAERVTVLLDAEMSRRSVFRPAEIEPVSWE